MQKYFFLRKNAFLNHGLNDKGDASFKFCREMQWVTNFPALAYLATVTQKKMSGQILFFQLSTEVSSGIILFLHAAVPENSS